MGSSWEYYVLPWRIEGTSCSLNMEGAGISVWRDMVDNGNNANKAANSAGYNVIGFGVIVLHLFSYFLS